MHCRIFLDIPLLEGASVDIDAAQARYLRQVMRLQAGDGITVFNGLGGEFKAELTLLTKESGVCVLGEWLDVTRELPVHVHIIQAANRSEKIETVLQKGTELGASSFQIINSARATLNLPAKKLETRLQRWQSIVIEAAEQSERTFLPSVVWRDKLSQIHSQDLCFVLHPRDAKLWRQVRAEILQAQHITLAIGPEGGWTNQEIEVLQGMGFTALCFGSRIMRTETAAPALLAAVQAVV